MKGERFYEERGLDRIIGLSDCVFAFSLTLLALDLVVPDLQVNNAILLKQSLLDEIPRFLYFFITFFITSAYWRSHHRIFRFIKRYDDVLMQLNLVLLVFIILMPFVTKLINEHGSIQLGVIIAAVGYAIPGFLLSGMWHYSSKGYRLIEDTITEDYIRETTLKNYIIPSVFLFSILFSFIKPSYTLYSWFLFIPLKFLLQYKFKADKYKD